MHNLSNPPIRSWAAWVLLVAVVGGSSSSLAQEPGWVVLGAGIEDDHERLVEWRDRIEARLRADGERVLAGRDLAGRIREEISAPFEPAPPDLVRAIGDAVEPALYDVASGNTAAARERAVPLLDRADAHLTAINLSPQAGSDLADLCYVVVRSYLMDRDHEAARGQVLACRRRTAVRPGERLHPPEVRRLFDEVTERIESGDASRLTVQIPAGLEEPCAVLVNGQPTDGDARRAVRVFVTEGEWAVGLRCGDEPAPRRLHRVRLTGGAAVRVVIDPGLDRAITGGDGILTYPAAGPEPAVVHQHARAVGDAIGAQGVLLVTTAGGRVEVERIPTSARAQVAVDADEQTVGDALAAVLAGRTFHGGDGDGGAGVVDSEPPSGGGRPIVGPLLLGVGGLAAVGVVVGSVVAAGCVERAASGRCAVEDELQAVPTALYGAAGGLALTGAVLWFLLGGGADDSAETETARAGIGPGTVELEVRF